MKANLLKSISVLAGLVLFTACPGPKKDNNANANQNNALSVGPQGQIKSFGDDSWCDFANGTFTCHFRNASQQVCDAGPITYNSQDLNDMCSKVQSLYNQSIQGGACNVSGVTGRVLSEYCRASGVQPNPINTTPGLGRSIQCRATYNGSYPTPMYPLAAMPNGRSFSMLSISERRGGVLGFLGIGRKVGELRVNYIGADGKNPETLTATIKYQDRKTHRDVLVKHSGSASAELKMNATINGATITVSCNDSQSMRYTLNDVANLVCVGSSHAVGQEYEENIQFIRPLNSIVSGEVIAVTEAVSLSLDKATSMLTLNTNIDSVLGPVMSSASSLKADAMVEASEGLGKAKIRCSIK